MTFLEIFYPSLQISKILMSDAGKNKIYVSIKTK